MKKSEREARARANTKQVTVEADVLALPFREPEVPGSVNAHSEDPL